MMSSPACLTKTCKVTVFAGASASSTTRSTSPTCPLAVMAPASEMLHMAGPNLCTSLKRYLPLPPPICRAQECQGGSTRGPWKGATMCRGSATRNCCLKVSLGHCAVFSPLATSSASATTDTSAKVTSPSPRCWAVTKSTAELGVCRSMWRAATLPLPLGEDMLTVARRLGGMNKASEDLSNSSSLTMYERPSTSCHTETSSAGALAAAPCSETWRCASSHSRSEWASP
mmetsp:Transcript_56583/g.183985  ORF Transcript_56583/g.183985 Transcript_56583/m.183985 type:complete len:229 (-) Transcript_56583:1316-2002(-)